MTSTIESKLDKLSERVARGLLSQSEAVDGVLVTLTDTAADGRISKLSAHIPESLRIAVCDRIASLQTADYEWEPFLVGEGFTEEELRQRCKKLAHIRSQLS